MKSADEVGGDAVVAETDHLVRRQIRDPEPGEIGDIIGRDGMAAGSPKVEARRRKRKRAGRMLEAPVE
jgi:hypothetical protein